MGGAIKITFLPVNKELPASVADVQADGTFTAKCDDGRDGCAAGKFKVLLEVVMRPEDYVGRSPRPLPFPDTYMSAETTPKEVEIAASGTNDITIDIP